MMQMAAAQALFNKKRYIYSRLLIFKKRSFIILMRLKADTWFFMCLLLFYGYIQLAVMTWTFFSFQFAFCSLLRRSCKIL